MMNPSGYALVFIRYHIQHKRGYVIFKIFITCVPAMAGGGEVLTHHQHRLSTAAITPNILVQTRNGEMPENADDYMMMKDEWALI